MIKEAASEEPYMGEQMPLRWLRFEQEIAKLVAGDATHASYDQVLYNSIIPSHNSLKKCWTQMVQF